MRPVEPGQLLDDKYLITRRLGKGGMGVVFEAVHKRIGRRVAIKLLRAGNEVDPERLARFEREAIACGSLRHENIASVLDFSTDEEGRPYLIMELIDGMSLRDILRTSGPMPVDRVCSLTIQAARGLLAAHDAGILHRDLKLENLMVARRADGSDWLKLLDFGVAQLTQEGATLTRDGHTPGTAHYMAPEVARGERTASVSSDIYALGVVMFELLTGRKPYPGSNPRAVLYQIATRPAPPIETLDPKLPAWLCELVNRCLSRDPEKRPANAKQVIDELMTHEVSEPTNGVTQTQRHESAKAVCEPPTSTGSPLTSARSLNKTADTRLQSWLVGGVLVLVSVAVGVLATRHGDREPPSQATASVPESEQQVQSPSPSANSSNTPIVRGVEVEAPKQELTRAAAQPAAPRTVKRGVFSNRTKPSPKQPPAKLRESMESNTTRPSPSSQNTGVQPDSSDRDAPAPPAATASASTAAPTSAQPVSASPLPAPFDRDNPFR